MKFALSSIGLALVASGCALTSKSEALDVRWFNPEPARTMLTSAARDAPRSALAIELGRIASGLHLREKIAYRTAAYEVAYYDDKRWTERPEVYVRRELARTLFEERGAHRSLGGQAPVLDVEVLVFEEVRTASPSVRLRLRALVHDDREALLEKTFEVERPVTGDAKGFDGVVHAMAEALVIATARVADEALAAVAARRTLQ